MFTVTVRYCMYDTQTYVTDNPAYYLQSLNMLSVRDIQIERNMP